MSYLGVPPFGQTVRTVTEVTTQQDQVTFYPTGGYIPGYLDVDLDGSGLGSQDFTATDGLSVVLAQKAGAGSLFKSTAYWPVALADTMRRAEINGIVGAGGWAMRNRLINGDMRIDQRNAGASFVATIGGSNYLVDRFLIYDGSGGSHFTVQQNKGGVTPPAGFANYLGIATTSAVSAAAGNNFTLNQYIEGYNVADLNWGSSNAQPVTLSFWVQSSLTGTFAGLLQEDGGTAFYVYTYTISQANTWTFISVTIPGATIGTWNKTNSRGINVRWDLGMGSNFNTASPNAWSSSSGYTVSGAQKVVGTLNATFYITGVQLEKGSYATPFDFRSYGTELALCQRYFCKSFEPGVAPADGASGGVYSNLAAYTATNGYVGGVYTYPVQMRGTPSVVFYTNVSGAGPNKWNWFNGSWNTSAVQLNVSSSTCMSCVLTGMSGLTTYSAYLAAGHFTASSEL